jgi:tetratricopeptide (TPR) repeat protein
LKENYELALKHYKNALKLNPNLGGRERVGMGMCFYFLKKYELAKRTFLRLI